MDLYEVMAEGCHKLLNSQEIAVLYHAGELTRHDPCKPLGKTLWRTIDELFPLLKDDEGDSDLFASAATPARKPFPVLTLCLFTAALLASVVHFAWNRAHDEWNKESTKAGKRGEGLQQDARRPSG